MSIETSDVDLRVEFNEGSDLNQEISNFVEFCNFCEKFENVKPIITASVPVVKLNINLLKYKSPNKHFNEKLEKLKGLINDKWSQGAE